VLPGGCWWHCKNEIQEETCSLGCVKTTGVLLLLLLQNALEIPGLHYPMKFHCRTSPSHKININHFQLRLITTTNSMSKLNQNRTGKELKKLILNSGLSSTIHGAEQ